MLNFTHKRKSVTRILAPVALAVILAGCSAPGTQTTSYSADITAPASDSAASYLLKAESSEGAASIDWHILALKALIKEGRWPQADQQANKLAGMNLSTVQMAEWQLARATLRYQQGQPKTALETLNFLPWWTLADSQYRRYHLLRAELLTQTEQHFAAARERTSLSQYLNSSEREVNWQNLWQDLSQYNNHQLKAASISADETVLQGWVELSMIKNTSAQRPVRLKSEVEQWLQNHPEHPANSYLPKELQAIMSLEMIELEKVALLLPLSGKFESQGKAVRDGFLNAMLEDTERNPNTELSIYDTESEPMFSIVNKLQQDGIQLVIGPLQKEKITEFQSTEGGNITELALNEPQNLDLSQPNTCYFSLSPEQEAEQAAQHLYAKGHRSPMVMAPANDFGRRVSQAFMTKWETLTGTKAERQTFGSSREIQNQMAAVFGLTDSRTRSQQMEQVLGMSLETQARSRRDTDAVYLIANRNEVTLLKPFIEVAINPDVTPPKLYASSRTNPDNNANVSELSGIEFSDIPLLAAPDQSFTEQFEQLWPGQKNSAIRLHAFGMDAYRMITELPQMKVVEHYSTQGKTGQLSIDDHCVVQRQLDWAVFTPNGIAPVQ
ncbi:penicillin-binding protein activator [Photobacterium sp. 2_MG-2023]|uniref:Penicillin-binding protein activator LpoA n=1 Tax=Photobacterium arenosum TaxID=2774143 RepID=A0ABR9BKK0_9GAMM|nr:MULTISPECIES: penicillin-binding protein activator [Photobacterium]MBD8513084.1 penicillin-binding protein activator [Photobacterium arenosum]MDO6581969.1 penicillin-binding protein activator [Photobacterium sp. 2_MG-2023]